VTYKIKMPSIKGWEAVWPEWLCFQY